MEGTVEHIVWSSAESGFVIARLKVDEEALPITVRGVMPGVQVSERVRATGRWVDDARYGRQFEATSFLPVDPSTPDALEKHLASSLFEGIGPVFAKRLREHFGAELISVLDNEPQRLRDVPGIGPQRATAILASWRERRDQRDALLFLQGLGITPRRSTSILRRFGANTVRFVRENPYRLAREVRGIGFVTADGIARHLGIAPDSPHRVEAGLVHVLEEASRQGHCYLPGDDLLRRGEELLRQPEALLRAGRDALVAQGDLVDDRGVWLAALHDDEEVVALRLDELRRAPAKEIDVEIPSALAWAQERSGLALTQTQRDALAQALVNKVVVITGGPGTGKTTLVRALLDVWERKGLNVKLASPTGRASRRMEEATGRRAQTLHRLLEYSPRDDRFGRDAASPIHADALVVDEASMLDLPLARCLLDALPPGLRLVLVGDVEQLPSVGPGRVLADVIDSGVVPVIRLDVVFRQDEASLIITNAHRILRGLEPRSAGSSAGDFFVIERDDPAAALRTVVTVVADRIPARWGLDPRSDVQVLAPMRKGPCGTEELNAALRARLNPGPAVPRPRPGDRVMQTRNDYDKDVFNGDVGEVVSGRNELIVRFEDGRKVPYKGSEVGDLAQAWAVTIHKAQGSEYPAVVIPLLPQAHRMLQRNLLYTAVTRAKTAAILVGSRAAIARAVANARADDRFTALRRRLDA